MTLRNRPNRGEKASPLLFYPTPALSPRPFPFLQALYLSEAQLHSWTVWFQRREFAQLAPTELLEISKPGNQPIIAGRTNTTETEDRSHANSFVA